MLGQIIGRQQAFRDLAKYIPDDHSRQVSAETLVSAIWSSTARSVLDLGCGTGRSQALFRQMAVEQGVQISWRGVDIADSPEVRLRRQGNTDIDTFDGRNLPYEDGCFDIVFSDQVLEHVRHPDALMASVARVLRTGGIFLGSVSHLEPYHSYSIFNFTPYGLVQVLEEAGLEVQCLRPSVDGLTLIFRQLLRRPPFFRFFLRKASPLNILIDIAAFLFRLPPRYSNYLKLQLSGQFCFIARKGNE
jgi:SAM-dependent methyltransferase